MKLGGTGIVVELVEPGSIRDDVLDHLHQLQIERTAEERPHDKPVPREVLAAAVGAVPEFMEVTLFLARDQDGQAVGYAFMSRRRTGANPHLADVQMWANPAHRRRGVAAELLGAVCAAAEAGGQSLLRTTTTAGVGWGDDLCRHLGARRVHDRRTWRLSLERVDREEICLIAAQAAERARGYALEDVSGELPDDIVDEAVELLQFLNEEAPGDVQLENARITVPILREMEATWRAVDLRRHWLFVRHESSGALAGVADGVWQPRSPDTIAQDNAVIRPEFRGRSLALWMKSCLIDKVLDEWPQATEVRTTTNFPNPTMDSVDERLGFEPYVRYTVWLLEVETLRKWVEGVRP